MLTFFYIEAADAPIELFHGYTYSGHPLACAAGLATLDIYKQEQLFERTAKLESYFEQAVHSLKGVPHVIDIRNMGLVAGTYLFVMCWCVLWWYVLCAFLRVL